VIVFITTLNFTTASEGKYSIAAHVREREKKRHDIEPNKFNTLGYPPTIEYSG
jgi:hypothetical protein